MSRGECPNPQPDCKYAPKCFSDLHHLYYPKNQYRDIIAAEFRELPQNKKQLCRRVHEEIHATEPIPEKPSRREMLGAFATALEAVEGPLFPEN